MNSHNHQSSPQNTLNPLTTRPYQDEAVDITVDHTTSLVRQSLERLDHGTFETAGLLEMATGTGKTFTVGKYVEEIIELRDRFNAIYHTNKFQWLHVLVLTNLIDGLNQFRDDLFHGRTGEKSKDPILSEHIRDNALLKTFHSKADNLADLDEKYFTVNEEDEEEIFSKQNGRTKDQFFFSTFQTAIRKDLAYRLPYIDLIIIDEAHNVDPGSEYDALLRELSTLGRDGYPPMILPVTATPTNLTKELFWEPIFTFWLAKYIASPHSPNVDYRLIPAANAPQSAVDSLIGKVEQAKKCTDPKEKKQLVREIERDFEAIMASYPDMEALVHDLLHKRIGANPDDIEPTIIFASGTDEADNIAKTINRQCGTEVALSYHSYNDKKSPVSWSEDKKTGLERFASAVDPMKIIIAVDKLNESVDLPTVGNIVFWRGTDVERIFLQQFGRWLRGDGTVTYYDYVWGLKNFAWIGAIYKEYKEACGWGDDMTGVEKERNAEGKFRLLGDSVVGEERSINLSDLGFDAIELSQEVDALKLANKEQIQALWREREINAKSFWGKWKSFAENWNQEQSVVKWYILPTSLNGLVSALGGDVKLCQTREYITSLLEGREFKALPPITKEQLQTLWQKKEIAAENVSSSKWKSFAENWNQEHSIVRWYILPISTDGLVSTLWGGVKISRTREYIIALLEWREFKVQKKSPSATKEQLQILWQKKGIIAENLWSRKWEFFAESWNKEQGVIKWYMLPTSPNGLVNALGGDAKISKTAEYIIALLEWREFKVQKKSPSATKEQLQTLWQKKGIIAENVSFSKWRSFAESWNKEQSVIKWYTLPTSLTWLISALGGDAKISKTAEYIISLLEWREFKAQKKFPFATKEQLRVLWKKGEIDAVNFWSSKWGFFAEKWNQENSALRWYILPISPPGLISVLGGDAKVSTAKYIVALLEGREFKASATKSQLQVLWSGGEIVTEDVSYSKWKFFAENWNQEYSIVRWYTLPISFQGLIGTLGGDAKTSTKKEYIISLLEWREFTKK